MASPRGAGPIAASAAGRKTVASNSGSTTPDGGGGAKRTTRVVIDMTLTSSSPSSFSDSSVECISPPPPRPQPQKTKTNLPGRSPGSNRSRGSGRSASSSVSAAGGGVGAASPRLGRHTKSVGKATATATAKAGFLDALERLKGSSPSPRRRHSRSRLASLLRDREDDIAIDERRRSRSAALSSSSSRQQRSSPVVVSVAPSGPRAPRFRSSAPSVAPALSAPTEPCGPTLPSAPTARGAVAPSAPGPRAPAWTSSPPEEELSQILKLERTPSRKSQASTNLCHHFPTSTNIDEKEIVAPSASATSSKTEDGTECKPKVVMPTSVPTEAPAACGQNTVSKKRSRKKLTPKKRRKSKSPSASRISSRNAAPSPAAGTKPPTPANRARVLIKVAAASVSSIPLQKDTSSPQKARDFDVDAKLDCVSSSDKSSVKHQKVATSFPEPRAPVGDQRKSSLPPDHEIESQEDSDSSQVVTRAFTRSQSRHDKRPPTPSKRRTRSSSLVLSVPTRQSAPRRSSRVMARSHSRTRTRRERLSKRREQGPPPPQAPAAATSKIRKKRSQSSDTPTASSGGNGGGSASTGQRRRRSSRLRSSGPAASSSVEGEESVTKTERDELERRSLAAAPSADGEGDSLISRTRSLSSIETGRRKKGVNNGAARSRRRPSATPPLPLPRLPPPLRSTSSSCRRRKSAPKQPPTSTANDAFIQKADSSVSTSSAKSPDLDCFEDSASGTDVVLSSSDEQPTVTKREASVPPVSSEAHPLSPAESVATKRNRDDSSDDSEAGKEDEVGKAGKAHEVGKEDVRANEDPVGNDADFDDADLEYEYEVTSDDDERVYCVCKQKADGRMVCCDRCDEWFHFRCVGLDETRHATGHKHFYCPTCRAKSPVKTRSLSRHLTLSMKQLEDTAAEAAEAAGEESRTPLPKRRLNFESESDAEFAARRLGAGARNKRRKLLAAENPVGVGSASKPPMAAASTSSKPTKPCSPNPITRRRTRSQARAQVEQREAAMEISGKSPSSHPPRKRSRLARAAAKTRGAKLEKSSIAVTVGTAITTVDTSMSAQPTKNKIPPSSSSSSNEGGNVDSNTAHEVKPTRPYVTPPLPKKDIAVKTIGIPVVVSKKRSAPTPEHAEVSKLEVMYASARAPVEGTNEDECRARLKRAKIAHVAPQVFTAALPQSLMSQLSQDSPSHSPSSSARKRSPPTPPTNTSSSTPTKRRTLPPTNTSSSSSAKKRGTSSSKAKPVRKSTPHRKHKRSNSRSPRDRRKKRDATPKHSSSPLADIRTYFTRKGGEKSPKAKPLTASLPPTGDRLGFSNEGAGRQPNKRKRADRIDEARVASPSPKSTSSAKMTRTPPAGSSASVNPPTEVAAAVSSQAPAMANRERVGVSRGGEPTAPQEAAQGLDDDECVSAPAAPSVPRAAVKPAVASPAASSHAAGSTVSAPGAFAASPGISRSSTVSGPGAFAARSGSSGTSTISESGAAAAASPGSSRSSARLDAEARFLAESEAMFDSDSDEAGVASASARAGVVSHSKSGHSSNIGGRTPSSGRGAEKADCQPVAVATAAVVPSQAAAAASRFLAESEAMFDSDSYSDDEPDSLPPAVETAAAPCSSAAAPLPTVGAAAAPSSSAASFPSSSSTGGPYAGRRPSSSSSRTAAEEVGRFAQRTPSAGPSSSSSSSSSSSQSHARILPRSYPSTNASVSAARSTPNKPRSSRTIPKSSSPAGSKSNEDFLSPHQNGRHRRVNHVSPNSASAKASSSLSVKTPNFALVKTPNFSSVKIPNSASANTPNFASARAAAATVGTPPAAAVAGHRVPPPQKQARRHLRSDEQVELVVQRMREGNKSQDSKKYTPQTPSTPIGRDRDDTSLIEDMRARFRGKDRSESDYSAFSSTSHGRLYRERSQQDRSESDYSAFSSTSHGRLYRERSQQFQLDMKSPLLRQRAASTFSLSSSSSSSFAKSSSSSSSSFVKGSPAMSPSKIGFSSRERLTHVLKQMSFAKSSSASSSSFIKATCCFTKRSSVSLAASPSYVKGSPAMSPSKIGFSSRERLTHVLKQMFDGKDNSIEIVRNLRCLEHWVFNGVPLCREAYSMLFDRLWHPKTKYRTSLEIFKTLQKLHACSPADWIPTHEDWPLFYRAVRAITNLEHTRAILLKEEKRSVSRAQQPCEARSFSLLDSDDDESDSASDSAEKRSASGGGGGGGGGGKSRVQSFSLLDSDDESDSASDSAEEMLITDDDVSTFLKQAMLLVRFFVDVFDKDLKLREKRSQQWLQKLERKFREQDRARVVPFGGSSSSSSPNRTTAFVNASPSRSRGDWGVGTFARGDTVVISPPGSPTPEPGRSTYGQLSRSSPRGGGGGGRGRAPTIDLTRCGSNEGLSADLSRVSSSSSSGSSGSSLRSSTSSAKFLPRSAASGLSSHNSFSSALTSTSTAAAPTGTSIADAQPQSPFLLSKGERTTSAGSSQGVMDCDFPSLSQSSVRSDDSCLGPPDFSKSLLAILIRAAEKHLDQESDTFALDVMKALTQTSLTDSRSASIDARMKVQVVRTCDSLRRVLATAFPHLHGHTNTASSSTSLYR